MQNSRHFLAKNCNKRLNFDLTKKHSTSKDEGEMKKALCLEHEKMAKNYRSKLNNNNLGGEKEAEG